MALQQSLRRVGGQHLSSGVPVPQNFVDVREGLAACSWAWVSTRIRSSHKKPAASMGSDKSTKYSLQRRLIGHVSRADTRRRRRRGSRDVALSHEQNFYESLGFRALFAQSL